MRQQRRSRLSWRAGVPTWSPAPETRFVRPELWLAAAALVGVLLAEVWQSSHVAQLSLELAQKRAALESARARLLYVRADLERRTTRAETAPLAARLGLAPADAQQVVALPSRYLVADATPHRTGQVSALALAERASRALVPEATAKSRAGN
jgi:hypothetical protein